MLRNWFNVALPFVRAHYYHLVAGVLLFSWVLPYFATGNHVEWGDFSFFAQAYEAMRVSILHYHQFPWFNPWMSGGVPLYANPQIGLFSIQMLLVLVFGTVMGLKISLAIYTVVGYIAMYVLTRKYFKIDPLIATLLSLIWIFCSFFVSHLPAHYTFAWYLLAPGFFYLALTVRSWKRGALLGAAFGIMGLSQLHNPFFHIALITGTILAARFILQARLRKELLLAVGSMLAVFVVLVGHRLLFTYQNVHDFPHVVSDPAVSPLVVIEGLVLPLSFPHAFQFIGYPQNPQAPYGFGEVSATIGIFALSAVFLAFLYIVYEFSKRRGVVFRKHTVALVLLAIALLCVSLSVGRVFKLAPYNFLKHLPVFSEMRVSTRWLIFFDLALLCFVGVIHKSVRAQPFLRFAFTCMLCLGVTELFYLNVGYQARILARTVVISSKPSWDYNFQQTSYFGQTRSLPDGGVIPDDGNMPHAYREYEATTWNLGILYANDSLVQLALDPRRIPGGHPTCPWEEGCSFVLSKNATVSYWSPNKVILTRTGNGPIRLNMNDSNYFLINGQRQQTSTVVAPFTDFAINLPGSTKVITIESKPSMFVVVKSFFHKQQPIQLR